jgi:hypothetical protein
MKTIHQTVSTLAIGSLFSAIALTTLSTAAQAATLTQWNFNSVPVDSPADTTTGTLTPSIGSGAASTIGGTTATFAAGGTSATGNATNSTDPATTDDSGWNLTNFPAQGTTSKTAGAQFLVSTLGFQNIIISFDQRHSNTSARDVVFQYTTNGSVFTDFANFSATAGDTWFNNRTVDLSSIVGVNNNANFGFRIVSAFAPSTSAYAASGATSTYATSGNSTGTYRFDMVTVQGEPVPEPTTIATGLLAVGAGRMIQRKRQKATKAAVK